ncbi:hypothetical protein [Streptomyces sp. BB1-1-1]|uniref:hypothetical protein n=1 Tax=Streptomyces sp. BB1-1-1 TaxID=3074430 RepID=UPI0037DA37CA
MLAEVEPDEAILSINQVLEGAPSSTDTAGLAARITTGQPESTVVLGLTASRAAAQVSLIA